jgi:hypothetical protein
MDITPFSFVLAIIGAIAYAIAILVEGGEDDD